MGLTVYLGIDVGSVTTKLALVDEKGKYVDSYMLRTAGKPVMAVQKGLNELYAKRITDYDVMGVGTTGSGRNLAGALVGADIIKNEITAHAVAASINVPGVQTILEIGGQDSKIIIMRDGIVTDFAMNTVCAAGTGSFLDHQAQRLNVPIEQFGETALKSENPARIAGRCGVFAESDLIHKQQLGYPVEDLLYGLCQALVRNYLANPDHHQTMGAIGAGLLAMENHQYTDAKTTFKGWEVGEMNFHSITCDCTGCSNNCEVITIVEGGEDIHHVEKIKDIKGNIIARWGGTCGRWDIS